MIDTDQIHRIEDMPPERVERRRYSAAERRKQEDDAAAAASVAAVSAWRARAKEGSPCR